MTMSAAGIKTMSETDRMWERTACNVPVSVIQHPTNFVFQGTIYNVCNGGLYLESGYRIQLSQTLILRLSGKPVQAQQTLRESIFYLGEVVWIRNLAYSLTADYGMGIRLLLCERKDA
jgi:hypothetical protein